MKKRHPSPQNGATDSQYAVVNKNECETIMEDWKKQFSDAISPGNEEEGKATSILQWIVHLLTVVFKVACAFVPPPQLLYGWAAFFVAL